MPILHKLLASLKTLKGFVFLSMVAIALLVFLGATLASSLLYEKLLMERTQATSREIAAQNHQAVLQVLRKGGSRRDLMEAISAAQRAFPSMVEQIVVHAAPDLQPETGKKAVAALSPDISRVFETGQALTLMADEQIRYRQPLRAEADCIRCHAGVRPGQVMGVLAIDHNASPVAPQVRLYYISLFLGLGLLVLLAATVVSMFTQKKIQRGVDLLRDKAESVNSVRDLEQFNIDQVDLGFQEFNQTLQNVALLVDKMKRVAVDKDVLEFEIRLLEKFIITSNVVKDWREFISELLLDINPIIDAYALVTIFRIEEEAYECEIFWRGTPADGTRQLFETALQNQMEHHPHFSGGPLLHIVHNIADSKAQLPPLSLQDIELQTKSLLLETPRIGGIVGIGLHSSVLLDNVRHMVIGSILTTLLNLVGSVKAIYKYTKDLEHYATRDPLTNLYNQRMFWELLGYEVGRSKRHGQKFAVMVLDMDNFKTINDRYGHHFGDSFLKDVATILQHSVRSGDMVTRYGGDEFAIVLPEADDTQAHMIASRIVDGLESHVINAPDGYKLKATTSIGIAISPTHGDSPKDLFLIADNMMYKAKKAGKNCIVIPTNDEMAELFRKASDKNLMIQKALDEKRIRPFFQPISKMANGEIQIHELLMRIELENHIVTANDFIDVAENMGIVHKMDYQLIEQAFIQVNSQGYPGMLFINLSPKALIVSEFIARVRALAEAADIEPQRIVFEITERETVSNLSRLEKFVQDLKMQGFSFAIDDFGSGFSSYQYIKHFPIDYIKIEGEFIRNMVKDEVYRAIIKSIVTLARELGIKTIAEYIEDAGVLDAVKEFGIDYAQGYYIGRPSPSFISR
jgi:diguanylate cyclase (GGDEF)-like protein